MASVKSHSKVVSIGRTPLVHPLDPLSPAEVSVAVATVRAAGATPELRDAMRFIEVSLNEPPKDVVALADAYFFPPYQHSVYIPPPPNPLLPPSKAFPPPPSSTHPASTSSSLSPSSLVASPSASSPSPKASVLRLPPREARLVTWNKLTNQTAVWVVELAEVHASLRGGHHRGRVKSSHVMEDVQPPMDAVEYAECEAAVKAHPPFQEAMRRRGVDDMELVMVDAWCVGYFSEADHPSRRLAKPIVFCRCPSDCSLDNGYARPVEGIYVTVDMQACGRNLHYSRHAGADRGGVDRSDLKPIKIEQPDGPSFRVAGYAVEWQKWSFRVGFTPKEGLVLHSLAYDDGSSGRRGIAHRLSFCEMVVPYGDPNDPHYRKNAFDAGEDGLGKNAHSLKKGCDCLGLIRYFDAHMSNFIGGVETIENVVCMHEEDHGMLWKHVDWRSGHAEVRRSRRLVLSFVCTVANYEYGFFWYLYQDGKIEAQVKLTGILSVGAVRDGEERKYGTLLAPGLYAPIHQHFFVARMDMAVDCRPGEKSNQVVELNVRMEKEGPHNPHANAFYAEERVLRTEGEGMRDVDPLAARHWLVQNTRAVNRAGRPTAYKLVPGSNCLPFAQPEAKFLRRAAFLKHNLWVTPYHPEERFPGGEFPNQNPRVGEGLPLWVQQNRPIDNADVVLWYVFGLTHVPRLEDWPVMPCEYLGFCLMPHGFFNISPAVDVPPSEPESPAETGASVLVPTNSSGNSCCTRTPDAALPSKL
ncbi:hypothetical protein CLOP_g24357 [Closterium sp. NIES-67]|nr:hypothetical protein CLOP_g24357 [Closterium sp. NIES-67]